MDAGLWDLVHIQVGLDDRNSHTQDLEEADMGLHLEVVAVHVHLVDGRLLVAIIC
jgi:hypothetical protein